MFGQVGCAGRPDDRLPAGRVRVRRRTAGGPDIRRLPLFVLQITFFVGPGARNDAPTRVGSPGPIVPTFRPFGRRCCRTGRRGRSLWPCRETPPREALDPLHGRGRPHSGAEAPRQPRAPTPPPQGCGRRAEPRPARLPPAGQRRPVNSLCLTAAARRRPRTRPGCAGGVPPSTARAADALRRPLVRESRCGGGTGRPPSMSIIGRDPRPQGVDPGLGCRHLIGRSVEEPGARRPSGPSRR
jgi:hypothetical protein